MKVLVTGGTGFTGKALVRRLLDDGHEGGVIRNNNSPYEVGVNKEKRSYQTLKIKPRFDSEFKIIGGRSAEGSDSRTVVFRCVTAAGGEFDVRPRGSREQRREWLENLDSLIGQQLTVQFFGFTDGDLGIPRFPVGIAIRNYE